MSARTESSRTVLPPVTRASVQTARTLLRAPFVTMNGLPSRDTRTVRRLRTKSYGTSSSLPTRDTSATLAARTAASMGFVNPVSKCELRYAYSSTSSDSRPA